MSKFQQIKMLCSKCGTSLVSLVISVQNDGEKCLLLLNVAFVVEILGIGSREHCQIVKILHKMFNRGKKSCNPPNFVTVCSFCPSSRSILITLLCVCWFIYKVLELMSVRFSNLLQPWECYLVVKQ